VRGRPTPEGIRITQVGLWYVLFTVVAAVAATNTGNNALYMVVAAMLGLLVVSGLTSRHNLRRLEVAVETPAEVFANRPAQLGFLLRNRSRLLPRWLLLFAVSRSSAPRLVPFLPRRGTSRGKLEMLFPRRGVHRFEGAHLSSLFPLGLFKKGLRYPLAAEVLVFPEIYGAASARLGEAGRWGDDPSRRGGWGHDLHALRAFRPGDDPRGIHWKQTARTGAMVFMEREVEESRRLSIVFDNAVGELREEGPRLRFEHLVSEAATAALDYLERGFEVELVTRDTMLPFAAGHRQRWAILEALALIAPRPRSRQPIGHLSPSAPQLRLTMEPEGVTG
jgi:uncharacterized protein (DUF58 family)